MLYFKLKISECDKDCFCYAKFQNKEFVSKRSSKKNNIKKMWQNVEFRFSHQDETFKKRHNSTF